MKYIENIKGCYKHIPYTWAHKKAFVQVERSLTGKVRLRSYLHDSDKLVMYALSPLFMWSEQTVNKIHRELSSHHVENGTDFLSMVIDWECARHTKPDKPLNARKTMQKYYPWMRKYIEPILKDLGL